MIRHARSRHQCHIGRSEAGPRNTVLIFSAAALACLLPPPSYTLFHHLSLLYLHFPPTCTLATLRSTRFETICGLKGAPAVLMMISNPYGILPRCCSMHSTHRSTLHLISVPNGCYRANGPQKKPPIWPNRRLLLPPPPMRLNSSN